MYVSGTTISWLGLLTMMFDTHVEATVALEQGKESITFLIPLVGSKLDNFVFGILTPIDS